MMKDLLCVGLFFVYICPSYIHKISKFKIMTDTVITKIEAGVMHIILNRPDRYHAFNREMALGLQEAFHEAMRNEEVRAIYFTASGKAFCSGQDLKEAEDLSTLDLEVL